MNRPGSAPGPISLWTTALMKPVPIRWSRSRRARRWLASVVFPHPAVPPTSTMSGSPPPVPPSAGLSPAGIRLQGETGQGPALFEAPHELLRDDVALDLVGALAHDHERRVAVVALEGVLGRVAVAAVDPDGIERDRGCHLRREQLGHACFEVRPPPLVEAAG